ncbi:hypothetical protein VTK56DRAFT_8115 [Thermocarpiscus australiensis]
MSATKIQSPVYKVYEPGYHPQRTIIVDEQIESPETLTIRLEEEAARNGGDLSGGYLPGLLSMSTYKSQPSQLHGFPDSAYSQYSAQSFSAQQTDNAASQINQLAFAANSTTEGHYLAAEMAPGINIDVLSCYPNSGSPGAKVSLKVRCQYDLLGATMTASAPFISLLFGSRRCTAQVSKEPRDGGSACTYTVTAEAPQFLSTACPSLSNVPLTLLLESSSGEEMARVENAAVFSYDTAQNVAGERCVDVGIPGDSSPPDLGSPVHQGANPPHQSLQGQTKTVSSVAHHALPDDSSTTTYGFSPSVSSATNTAARIQALAHPQSEYSTGSAAACGQGSSNMLAAYRGASFTDPYSRAPPMLRSPLGGGWMFGSPLEPIRTPASTMTPSGHAPISRTSLTPLHHSSPTTPPHLVRTSTLAQGSGGNYHGHGAYQEQVTLKLMGDLASMAEGWTQEEWQNKRRLVLFKRQQTGSVLTVSFKPVSAAERPPQSICISCIWWEEKQGCYVTSVDIMHLLEQLLAPRNRFGVDEKNRIRRNLEGFRPVTVSKSKAEGEEFFKIIMGFGNPKPRNIEKDIKVYQWKDLSGALYKIISKYSASSTTTTAAMMSPNTLAHVTQAVHGGASYPALPPTPVSTPSAPVTDPATSAYYVTSTPGHHVHHHPDPMASPRTLTGGPSAWSTYSTASRTLSPALKTSSPVSAAGLRSLSALPALVYDHLHRGSPHALPSPYGLPGPGPGPGPGPSYHSNHHHHGTHHGHGHGHGHEHGHGAAYSSSSGLPAPPPSHGHTHARSWQGGYAPLPGGGDHAQSGGGAHPHAHGQVYGGGGGGGGGGSAYEDHHVHDTQRA